MNRFEIYIEGSGDTDKLQQIGREAMRKFLSGLSIDGSFQLNMCGSRAQAYKEFCWAIEVTKPGVIPILLVDAESPMDKNAEPWAHLKASDGWDTKGATNDQAYLMVQTMEAWLVCDPSAWKKWNPRANMDKLPKIHNSNVESIVKFELTAACESVCKSVNKSYVKDKRLIGFGVLKFVQPKLVRENSKEADRFFKFIEIDQKGNAA